LGIERGSWRLAIDLADVLDEELDLCLDRNIDVAYITVEEDDEV
jgi:hypothetical protein